MTTRKQTKTQARFWVQGWEESEAGWGVRPDGFTVHLTRQDIATFLGRMRAEEAKSLEPGEVPSEYSRPSGEPFLCPLDQKLRPEKGSAGRWLPHGWHPPKAVEAQRTSGWVKHD